MSQSDSPGILVTPDQVKRAARTLSFVGKGLHPDEGLAVLADVLGLTWTAPQYIGPVRRHIKFDQAAIDKRVAELEAGRG